MVVHAYYKKVATALLVPLGNYFNKLCKPLLSNHVYFKAAGEARMPMLLNRRWTNQEILFPSLVDKSKNCFAILI